MLGEGVAVAREERMANEHLSVYHLGYRVTQKVGAGDYRQLPMNYLTWIYHPRMTRSYIPTDIS